jgi:hypothetical protein
LNKRADPTSALRASSQQLRRALSHEAAKLPSEEIRTTFSVPLEVHDALRLLAAKNRCWVNDLVTIALENILAEQQLLPGAPSRSDLRGKLHLSSPARTAGSHERG